MARSPSGILPGLLDMPPLPSPMPSPLAAVHHPTHEVPGVRAAVPQRASGAGELQKVTRALGMQCGTATSVAIPWAGASPHGLGPSLFRAGQDEALPSGALQSPPAEELNPAQPLDPAHSLPLPCSLLTLLWHHTLSVLTAARGPPVPSVQHSQRLFCALKVPRGSRGCLARTGVRLVADSIIVPRAWSCASTLRAVGCRWRPSTVKPSGYGDGHGESPWVPLGGRDAREAIPGLWTCPCA